MSFFKNFLAHKSQDSNFESKVSVISRETLETNPRVRSNSSSHFEDFSSSRNRNKKEKVKYLDLVNQELNSENERLK